LAAIDDGDLPGAFDALSGPLLFGAAEEEGDASLRQHHFPFVRTLSSTRQILAVCPLPFAGRFRLISLRLKTVSEEWSAVMCSLCQYA